MHIVIIDDHELVRDGIRNLVEQEFGWQVAFAVAALEQLPDLEILANIDVAIIDISLQDASGFDVLAAIKADFPYVRCLMLSMYEHVGYITKALELGADGYVTKTAATKELMSALEATKITIKLDELYNAMKRSIGRLRPAGIDSLPLESVLRNSETLKTMQRAGIQCQLNSQGTPLPLDDEVRINIYRIIQEALTNIAKHADATAVTVDIIYAPRLIRIAVTDNGIGLQQSAAPPSSLGLISMRERARFFGAQLTIDAHQHQGTRVELTLPVATQAKSLA